jgi:hypothetical protein
MPKTTNTQRRTKKKARYAHDIAKPAYRRLERIAMHPDDSLFIAALIGGAVLFAWLVTMW